MNRFKEILDDLSRRQASETDDDKATKKALGGQKEQAPVPAEDQPEPLLRLPYSSDPKPIEDPWD
jgi:hypothetical protein